MKKKFAWMLVLSLVFSLVPATALLAEDDECEYCLPDYICEYCAEEADENGEEDAEENGDDADENGYEADENGDEADENGDEADENGDDADEDADDADEVADYADEDEDYLPEPMPIEIVPIAIEIETVLRFVIGDTIYTRNGVAQPALDVAPFIDAAAARTMVPIRAVSEGLGATVTWNRETRNVTIIRGDVTLVINVDSELPDGMGTPTIIDGRTFVPLAYVSEQLGATVDWDGTAQAVYVSE